LLVSGYAGSGKTHLLRQVALQRIGEGQPTLLFLGRHFRDAEPWAQIIERAHLTCSRDEFLGALETAAWSSRARALILIDALNEGSGRILWPSSLPGLLYSLENHPRIAFG